MKLFDIFKKKKEKSILEKSLEEIAKIGKNQPVKGLEVVDKHYKIHPFNERRIKNKKWKRVK